MGTGRLRRGREFDDVYEKGSVSSGPLLVLRYRENGRGETRWAFAVGKRLAPHAVDRNRLRRKLREAAMKAGARGGLDIVVTARREALGRPYGVVAAALRGQVSRAGLEEEE